MAGSERILIIDDDEKLCRLIQEYLGAMGYDAESVHTERRAFKRPLQKTIMRSSWT